MGSRRIDRRHVLLTVFAFGMASALGFLGISKFISSSAISAAYSGFKAGNIINDYVMGNYTTMSESDIQNFLKSKNSCNDTNVSKARTYSNHTYHIVNGHFVCMADESFNGESAAHIIYQAAQDFKINPQVLIVLLEKEQGLVTDTWPNSDLQYRSATGYGCPDTAACDSKYYGFKNQVRLAAQFFRRILNKDTYNQPNNYPVGNNRILYNPNTSCGSSTVYVENLATGALYTYTPYQPNNAVLNANPGTQVTCGAYGNSNFYYYFTKWFGDTHGAELSGIYIPDGTYQLTTTGGKALSFADNSKSNGATAIITDANTSDTLQQFQVSRVGKYYRFKNVASGRYLDVFNNDSDNGTKVELWDGNSSCAQKWLIQNNGAGYRLISACSSEAYTKSLDVYGAAVSTSGTKVTIWETNASAAQIWSLKNLSSAVISDGTYNVKSTGGKLLAPSSESASNGNTMLIWENTSSKSERFKFTRTTEGYYRIQNAASGLYLAASSSSASNGINTRIAGGDGNSCTQKWVVEKWDSSYRLRSSCSGNSLDINGGYVSVNNTKVQLWGTNNSNAQKWSLTSTLGQVLSDGEYNINSVLGNNMRLDVNGSGTPRNGTNVQIWTKNLTASQKFTVKYDSNTGYYTLYNTYSKRYLDVDNKGSSGSNAQVYSAGDGCYQRWILVNNGSGVYRIVSSCTRTALDVFGATAKNGTNVGVYTDKNSSNQRWTFSKPVTTQLIQSGTYTLESAVNSNYNLDVNGSSTPKNGTNVQLWTKNSSNSQKFQVTYDTYSGNYILKNLFSNRPLDATGAVARNGTNVEVWAANSSCAQQWDVKDLGNGYYRLVSACGSGYSLDVTGAIARNGVNVELWANNNTSAQKWKFNKV